MNIDPSAHQLMKYSLAEQDSSEPYKRNQQVALNYFISVENANY